jgi:hypothetical protein
MKYLNSEEGDIIEFIRDNLNIQDIPYNLLKEDNLHTSLMYISNKFDNITTVNYEGVLYNRIYVNIIFVINTYSMRRLMYLEIQKILNKYFT